MDRDVRRLWTDIYRFLNQEADLPSDFWQLRDDIESGDTQLSEFKWREDQDVFRWFLTSLVAMTLETQDMDDPIEGFRYFGFPQDLQSLKILGRMFVRVLAAVPLLQQVFAIKEGVVDFCSDFSPSDRIELYGLDQQLRKWPRFMV
jgi:hypothetical protein